MIIALSGKLGSGKTTIAKRLVSEHGFRKISFAGPLKEACRAIFGFTDEQLYGSLKKEIDPFWGLSPGRVLQLVGTELFRVHFDSEVWVKSLIRTVQLEQNIAWVVDDMRFPNELEAIKKLGGVLIRVERPEAVLDARDLAHPSETSLDNYKDWSFVISNDGSMEELIDQVDRLVIELRSTANSTN